MKAVTSNIEHRTSNAEVARRGLRFDKRRYGVGLALLLVVAAGSSWGAPVCSVPRFNDWKDLGCDRAWLAGKLGNASLGMGGNQSQCVGGCPTPSGSAGMPRWWVSEPRMNLWMTDEPLSYRTSGGQAMTFRWTHRQRHELPPKDACPSYYYVNGVERSRSQYDSSYGWMRTLGMTNATWNHNWMSDVVFWDLSWELLTPLQQAVTPKYRTYEAFIHRADGTIGYVQKPNNGQVAALESSSLAQLIPLSGLTYPTVGNPVVSADGLWWCEGSTNGFRLRYADGSEDTYGMTFNFIGGATTTRAFLTRRADPQGRVTKMAYERAYGTDPYTGITNFIVYRLRCVVDPDSRTNTFHYTTDVCATSPDGSHRILLFQVARVEDPYGRSLQVEYNATNRWPERLIDAAGLTNTVAYQGANGWITHLTTPYGETRFYHSETVTTGTNRCVRVQQPDDSWQMFFYRNVEPNLPANAGTNAVPSVAGAVFDSATAGYYPGSWQYRNTFHWNARQCSTLAGKGYSSLFAPTLAAPETVLQPADYYLAAARHWLIHASDTDTNLNNSVASLPSWEREPSWDSEGLQPGGITWYAYGGQDGSNPALAPEGLPGNAVTARVLPNGETWFQRESYAGSSNPWYPGRVTQTTESATLANGTLGTRTNDYTYTLSTNADLKTLSGPLGWQVGLSYSAGHQVTAITNALGERTQAGYYANKLNSLVFPGGATLDLTYYYSSAAASNRHMLGLVTASTGRQLLFTWDQGLVKTASDERGLGVTNTWDGLNRLTSTRYPDGSYTSNLFDKLDLAGTRDRLGHWTWFGHDAMQRLTSVTDARSNVTRFGWCDCGSLEAVTNALNQVTTFYHNNQGKLTDVVLPDRSVHYDFDASGRLTNVVDGAGRWLRLAYNNQGLLTTASNANGRVMRAVYDERDRVKEVTDANNVTVTNTFDALDRLLARVWPDGIGEGYAWRSNGLAAVTNRNGQVTRYTRNSAGWVLGVTNANQEITAFAYNTLGQITSLWDGNTNRTQWAYDIYGRPTSKVNALDQEVRRWSYDPNGNLTNRWTPQFGDTAYAFDAVGNLTSLSSLHSTNSYAYDPLNRITNMLDAVGETRFGYSATGTLDYEDGPWADDTVGYSYFQGLRSWMTVAQPNGQWVQGYSYDAARRLQSVESPAGTFSYGYQAGNAGARVAYLTLPNSGWITNHFDALGRLDATALVNQWGKVLDSYAYTHDPLGLRTNVVRDFGWTSNSVSVGYDAIGQLTAWTGKELDGAQRLNELLRYAYDPAGNLRGRTNNTLTQHFGNNALNELTMVDRDGAFTVTGNTLTAATNVTVNGTVAARYADRTWAATNFTLANGDNTFTVIAKNPYGFPVTNTTLYTLPASLSLLYDLNGNLTNDGLRHFRYDAENQLTTNWVTGAWKQEFVYDGLGRKRIERSYGWTNNAWLKTNEVRLVWDRMLPIQERNENNQPLVSYTRGLDLSASLQGAGGIGGLLARTDHTITNANFATTYYHADGAGNITALVNTNGLVVARYLYDPFGRLLAKSGALADVNRYRFSSKELQPLSGLYYYGFRFYDPSLQRWLNEDPIQEAGGINLHRFVNNSPLNRVDPLGKKELAAALGAALHEAGVEFFADLIFAFFYDENPPPPQYVLTAEGVKLDREPLPPTPFAGEPRTLDLMLFGGSILFPEALAVKAPLKTPCPAAETGAANAANAARLRTQLKAEEIAGGHAFDKHVIQGGEFPGITTRPQFNSQIEAVINNASDVKVLSNGRTAYWDSSSGTVVIRNPNAVDGGTAFKPTQGKTYFDNLK